MYKRILIPTDGSELASKGVDHGLALAKALGIPATVINVTVPLAGFALQGVVQAQAMDSYKKLRPDRYFLTWAHGHRKNDTWQPNPAGPRQFHRSCSCRQIAASAQRTGPSEVRMAVNEMD
jgi:hypothetical protein